MLVSQGLIAARTILIWVVYDATRAMVTSRTRADVNDHVWIHVPTAARVCDDVHVLCYHRVS